MSAPLDLDQYGTDPIVLPTEWVTVRAGASDSTLSGSSTAVIVTATATPTPSATAQMRARSVSLGTTTTVATVDTLGTYRFSLTADTTDVIELQAQRTGGTGGLLILDVGGLQGQLNAAPDAPPVTQTGITAQPPNRSTTPGVPVYISVSAVGVNLTYLWERNSGGGWGAAPGTNTSAVYAITNVAVGDSGDTYRVTVSGDNDPGGTPVVSTTATLTVTTTTAAFTNYPALTRTVTEGSTISWSATGINIDNWEFYSPEYGGNLVGAGSGTWTTITASPIGPIPLSWDGWTFRFQIYGTDQVQVNGAYITLNVEPIPVAGGPTITDVERGA